MFEINLHALAAVLYRSVGDTKAILSRNNVPLTDIGMVIGMIRKYRLFRYVVKGKVKFKEQEISHTRARELCDEFLLKPLYDEVRGSNPSCTQCGTTDAIQVHHINYNHFDNRVENLVVLCSKCHIRLHTDAISLFKGAVLIPVALTEGFTQDARKLITEALASGELEVRLGKTNGVYYIQEELMRACRLITA